MNIMSIYDSHRAFRFRSLPFFLAMFLLFLLFSNITYSQQLDPGDGIRLTFYNITDEISGDYFIQQDGGLQLPYAGFFNTVDKDYEFLKSEVITKYDSLYRGVELIVDPLYRINVLGEVGAPGVYYATGVEKVLDMIAIAGGETEDSDMGDVTIVRKGQTIIFDADDIIEGADDTDDFFVTTGDRIYVSRKWWVVGQNTTFLIAAATLLVTTYAVFGD